MMILTMTAPQAPTTTAIGHVTKPCAQTNSSSSSRGRDEEEGNTSSMGSSGSSSSSLNSGCSNDTVTSCMNTRTHTLDPKNTNPFTRKPKKCVSFSFQQTAYFSPEQILSQQERKAECWYSETELNLSREEARMAISALHHQLQLDAAAAATPTDETTPHGTTNAPELSNEYGSWVLRCPRDETKIVCLRGIEKYADAAAKYAGQKRLVDSVLQQQSLNNQDIHVALVSRTLSQPFKEVARYYAMKSAEELDHSRKLEEEREQERKQQQEVATVLLLIMGQQQEQHHQQQQQQQQIPPNTPSTSSSSKLQQASPIVTPRGFISGKRSSFSDSPLCETRNVKPCIRATSDR